jgi:hypothetical protein
MVELESVFDVAAAADCKSKKNKWKGEVDDVIVKDSGKVTLGKLANDRNITIKESTN